MFASFALFAVHVSKRECPLEFRAVRVVRGSCFSTGVFVVILTAKCAKTANKNGSVPCSPETVPGRERGKENGVSPVVFGLTKRKCPL